MEQLLCREVVGRLAERRLVLDAAAAAADRVGGGLVLVGDAGMGKSRLLAHARQRAADRGVAVVVGRADPTSRVPFGPLREAAAGVTRAAAETRDPGFRSVRAALAQLSNNWTPRAAPESTPLAIAEAMLEVLGLLARDRGALLLVEDLHWADDETIAVVNHLLVNASDHHAQCLLTLRPTPPDAYRVVRRLADTRAAKLIDLPRLSDGEVDEMVLACLRVDAVSRELLSFIRSHADGVPFFVEELLAGLVRAGALVRVDDGWRVIAHRLRSTVPATLADSVSARFLQLHHRTQEVLHAAAVLGRNIDWELLAAVTDLDGEEVLACLREATYAQLLEGHLDGVRFRHALTREHVAALMLPPERAALARKARQAVELAHPALPGEWCELAARLDEESGNTDEAARRLVTIGRRAWESGALATAGARLERAIELAAPQSDIAVTATVNLASVWAAAGEVDRALALAERVHAHRSTSDGSTDATLTLDLGLAQALLTAGRYTQARVQASDVESTAAHRGERQTWLRAEVLLAEIAIADGDVDGAVARAQDVLGKVAGELPDAHCAALEVLGRAARLRDVAQAEQLFQAALAVAERQNLPLQQARALHELGTIDLLDTMRVDRLEAARRAALETGIPAIVAVADFHLAEALVARGRIEPGRAAATRAATLARRIGSGILAPALVTVGRSYAHECRAVEMEQALAAAFEAAPGDRGVEAGAWGRARVMLALHRADTARACADLDRAVRILRDLPGHHFPHWGLWSLLRTVTDSASGGAAARLEASRTPGSDTRFNRALLSAASAVAIGQTGDAGAANRRIEAAIADLRGYQDSEWLVHLTQWLVAPSANRDGWGAPLDWLGSAVRWFADHGYAPLATSCRTLLRNAGGQVPRRGRGESSVPSALLARGVTSREVDVLRLVGRRMPNRSIADTLVLSPRTVEKHVSSLLRKTGAADRDDLAALAARLTPR